VEQDGDAEIIHHRERWANELYLVYADGRTLKLTETPAKKEDEADGECTPGGSGCLSTCASRKGIYPNSPRSIAISGRDRQAHLLSVFGNDSDVGAITAAVHEKAAFNLIFPDGTVKDVTLGEHASCDKGAVTLPGRKHPVRHLLAVSQELHTMVARDGRSCCDYRREEAWATLVSFLGLPADPAWAEHILGIVEGKERGSRRLMASDASLFLFRRPPRKCLSGSGMACVSRVLSFPGEERTIVWPRFACRHHCFRSLRQPD